MASSPAKRRKLSAEPSIPKSAPNTPSRLQGPRDVIQTSIGRPSFASPTKASLSRYNPTVLTRSRSEGPREQRSSSKENELPPSGLFVTPAKVMEEEAGDDVEVSKAPQPPVSQPVSSQQTPQGKATRLGGGSLSAPPRRRSRTPGKPAPKGADSVDRQIKSVKGNEAHQGLPKDKAATPVPFRSAGLRRSPVALQAREGGPRIEVREAEEPELPLTPTQRGLGDPVVTTPPSGIHDTPSKRAKRPRAAKAKPSPLKAQQTPAEEAGAEAESESERAVKRRRSIEVASRQLIPFDPYVEKRKLRDKLRKELGELQADIKLAEQENDRHRRYHVSGKGPSEPPNPDEILNLLVRSTAALTPKAPAPKSGSISKSINSFLPFARRPRPLKVTLPKDATLTSHLPLPLEDQLPHLQLFTPLQLSSTITILPFKPSSNTATSSPNPILQNHAITISTASSLFSARMNMIVDTTRLSVSSLSVTSLDPSSEPELGRWVRERASSKSILGKDVSAICWAMARWFEVAMERAKFWCELERDLRSETGRTKSTARLKAGRRKKRPGVGEDVEMAGIREDEEAQDGEELKKMKWTRKQLLPQMKRTHFLLARNSVELRIDWNITFDWTGEAESIISASAKIPPSWQGEDERRSLAKVPQTFDNLVKARGPMAAVTAMVTLLMPS